jgi:O-antigen/teichoic acid export membrane protein
LKEKQALDLAKKSVGTLLTKGVNFFLGFPLSILTARYLGAGGKGILYLISLSVGLSVVLGHLGLGPASIYFIGRDKKTLPAVLANLLWFTAFISIVLIGGGWLFLRYGRPDIYLQLSPWMWWVGAVLVPINMLDNYLKQVLAAILRIKEINLLEMAAAAIQLLGVIVLVVILHKGLAGAFAAYAVSEVLPPIVTFFLVLRYGGRPAKPNWTLFKTSLGYGIKSYFFALMRRLNLRLDAFLVTILAKNGVQATGVYSVANGLAELILTVPESIRLSLFPMVAASSKERANQLTPTACRHTVFLTTILSLGFFLTGPFAIRLLYGKEFVGAVVPLFILLPGMILLCQARLLYSDMAGRGHPEVSTISAGAGLVITVILDFALIPSRGLTGAAIASSFAYSIEFLVACSLFVRKTGLSWREILLVRKSDLRHYPLFLASKLQSLSRP